uniref:Forkhead box protein K2 n=1 Tax=Schistocephalus solidus TaxID=70667 RepID=A0A0V0JC89_SCHSO
MRSRSYSMRNVFAVIYNGSERFLMRKKKIYIGRQTDGNASELQVASSSVISRRHLEVQWVKGKLYMRCLGKNGIFIDGKFKSNGTVLYGLPKRCHLRFPSTTTELTMHCLRTPKSVFSPSNLPCIKQLDVSGKREYSDPDSVGDRTALLDSAQPVLVSATAGTNRRKQQLGASAVRRLSSPTDTNSAVLHDGRMPPLTCDLNTSSPQQVHAPQSFIQCLSTNVSRPCNIFPSGVLNQDGGAYICELPTGEAYMLNAAPIGLVEALPAPSVAKPPFSFAQLIAQALMSQPSRRLTLAGIYNFISQTYPYYRLYDKGWQNSVRHNLSLSKYFLKAPRNPYEPGKGCFWRIDPQFEDRLLAQAYKRRRPQATVETISETLTCIPHTSLPANQVPFANLSSHATFIQASWSSPVVSEGPRSFIASPIVLPTVLLPARTNASSSAEVSFSVSSSSPVERRASVQPTPVTPVVPRLLPVKHISSGKVIYLVKCDDA